MISTEVRSYSHKQSAKPRLLLSLFSPEYYPESLSLSLFLSHGWVPELRPWLHSNLVSWWLTVTMVRPRISLTHYVTQGEALFKQASKGAGPSNTSRTRTALTLFWGCSKLLCLLLLRITEITQLSPWLWAVDRASPVFVNSRPTKSPSNIPSGAAVTRRWSL